MHNFLKFQTLLSAITENTQKTKSIINQKSWEWSSTPPKHQSKVHTHKSLPFTASLPFLKLVRRRQNSAPRISVDVFVDFLSNLVMYLSSVFSLLLCCLQTHLCVPI